MSASNPSYSVDGGTLYTVFPGAYLYGGKPGSFEEILVEHESEDGTEDTYIRNTRKSWTMHFRFSDDDYVAFYNFHVLTMGKLSFYFSPSGSGLDGVLVRREPHFDPQEMTQPRVDQVVMWDLTMVFKVVLGA